MQNTFLNLNSSEKKADFCFVGIECCSAEYLFGVERAANVVRNLSQRYANADGSHLPLKVYNAEQGFILNKIVAFDTGNVTANLSELEDELANIKLESGCVPIFVGGDHSVSYPIVKNILNSHDDIVVIQFDAHSDYIDEYYEYPHGSVMNEISKLDKVEKIIHFGLRGNLNSGPAIKQTVADGNMVILYKDISSSLNYVLEQIKGKKVYISFDMDFLNPAVAPATNCPEPGGPPYEETLEYLKNIISYAKEVVGMDIVEYNPLCEGATITGLVVVNIIMECMHYIHSKK